MMSIWQPDEMGNRIDEILMPQNNVDYLHQRIPATRDEEISTLIASSVAHDDFLRLAERIVPDHSQVLCAFSERMASLAVREENTSRLIIGLVALVLDGLDRGDREAILVLALHYRSAEKLGIKPDEIFDKAAELVGEPGAFQLQAFVKRREVDRNLASIGYREIEDKEGPVYERTW